MIINYWIESETTELVVDSKLNPIPFQPVHESDWLTASSHTKDGVNVVNTTWIFANCFDLVFISLHFRQKSYISFSYFTANVILTRR